jgi:hypothetical protein
MWQRPVPNNEDVHDAGREYRSSEQGCRNARPGRRAESVLRNTESYPGDQQGEMDMPGLDGTAASDDRAPPGGGSAADRQAGAESPPVAHRRSPLAMATRREYPSFCLPPIHERAAFQARGRTPDRSASGILAFVTPEDQGGDPACWLARLCDECGAFIEGTHECPDRQAAGQAVHDS